MACGTCRGMIPPQQRYIRKDAYTVQGGDYVSDICELFGVPLCRWQELVGANLHKELGEEPPYGYRHRCFKELQSGESLNIPACWPSGSGAVSAPLTQTGPQFSSSPVVTVDQLGQMIAAMTQAGIPNPSGGVYTVYDALKAAGVALPSGTKIEDAIAVAYSWWPYITWPNQWPGYVPSLPTTSMPVPQGTTFQSLVKLLQQAVEFLRATGIKDGTGNPVQKIPWDSIPWNTLPWKVIGAQALQELSQAMLGTPLPPYTTPPVAFAASQAPDFINTDWSNHEWITLLKDVNWSDSLVELLQDTDAVECMKKNPTRLKALSNCPQCYEDTAQFKAMLCSTEPADPCDCDETGGGGEVVASKDEDKTPLIIGGVVVGVLGIAAAAALLGRK